MRLIFSDVAWRGKTISIGNSMTVESLIESTNSSGKFRVPFSGIGKPEPLKHALSGYWSRRITDEHHIVYSCETDALLIAQLRFHY